MKKTFSLAEVADQVLPPEWRDSERWLARRLNRGDIAGYRVGRVWRMTEDQVEDLVDRFTNENRRTQTAPPASSSTVTVADGLSQRSRRRLRRAS